MGRDYRAKEIAAHTRNPRIRAGYLIGAMFEKVEDDETKSKQADTRQLIKWRKKNKEE